MVMSNWKYLQNILLGDFWSMKSIYFCNPPPKKKNDTRQLHGFKLGPLYLNTTKTAVGPKSFGYWVRNGLCHYIPCWYQMCHQTPSLTARHKAESDSPCWTPTGVRAAHRGQEAPPINWATFFVQLLERRVRQPASELTMVHVSGAAPPLPMLPQDGCQV